MTGCLSGSMNPAKLTQAINQQAGAGWRLRTTIKEEKRWLILFKREAHFLIFERDVNSAASGNADSTTRTPETAAATAAETRSASSSAGPVPPPLPKE